MVHKTTVPQKTSTRTKFISLVMALALACTMFAAVPGTAFAGITDDSTIAVSPNIPDATLTTIVGQTLAVGGVVGANGPENFAIDPEEDPANPGTAFGVDWTVAYLLNEDESEDPDAATVNKRTGILTPTAEGIVAVDVWMVNGVIMQEPGVPSNAVGEPATIFIEILENESNTYGAQGNNQTILMNTINGAAFSGLLNGWNGSSTTGFQNRLKPLTPASGALAFNFTMAAGTGPSFSNFVSFNAGDVQLFAANSSGAPTGNALATLLTDNTGNLFFDVAAAQSNTVTLNINTGSLTSSSGLFVLRFTPAFRGNNINRTLGVNVDFVFSIV